jgi:streptogramin lyase
MSLRIAGLALAAALCFAFAAVADTSLPDPYHPVAGWPTLPPGRKMGQVIGVYPAKDGTHMWAFERCAGRSCFGSSLSPIMLFDAKGKLVRNFGAGMFVFPHGLWVDRDGNLWVTDAGTQGGKGDQVFKLSPTGKVLMTLGTAGVEGETPTTFNKPTFALTAPNGDIFVADGHGNSRIVKFSKDGKFLMAWGKKGEGPSEFRTPHSLALDSQGRLFVADRENNRLQIFDQNGKFLAEWHQFGRPSGVYIDKNDTIYVTDSESRAENNPGFQRGISIGSARTGKVTAFIPVTEPLPPATQKPGPGFGTGAEGVATDRAGNVYGGETTADVLVKYAKK